MKTGRAFTIRYAISLAIIGLLVSGGYLLISFLHEQQHNASAYINISSRQRMLSQRIALFSLQLVNGESMSDRAEAAERLLDATNLFEQSHLALLSGGDAPPLQEGQSETSLTGFLPADNPSLNRLYNQSPSNLNQQVRDYITNARQLAQEPATEQQMNNPHLVYILTNGPNELLNTLDDAVHLYEDISETRDGQIEFLESLATVFTMAALLIVGVFVFRPMASRIEERTTQLNESNRALAKQNKQVQKTQNLLELAAAVGNRISRIREVDKLFREAVDLVKAGFDLYYAQIYIADATGRNLSMQAGTGEVGLELRQRAHRLPIGPGSINGTAAYRKQAVLVTDTDESGLFKANPLLPETIAELAVPLMVGDRVVGVLNLQSNSSDQLDRETVPAFETLASQLAVAIDNANLFVQIQQARKEIEEQAQRLTRTGWQSYVDTVEKGSRLRYTYSLDDSTPESGATDESMQSKLITVPISITGARVGAIQIENDPTYNWTDEDSAVVETVANQVAQKLENLRLLSQAEQYRQTAEEAVRRLTREGWHQYLQSDMEDSDGYMYDGVDMNAISAERKTADGQQKRPVQVQGNTIGEIAIGKTEVDNETSSEIMSAVATSLGAHLENLRLIKQTERRIAELNLVNEINDTVRTYFNLDDLLPRVGEQIRNAIGAGTIYIALYDKERRMIDFPYFMMRNQETGESQAVTDHTVPFGQGFTSQIITKGESILQTRQKSDEFLSAGAQQVEGKEIPASYIGVPLVSGNEVIGVISIQNQADMRSLNKNDLELLNTISASLGIAIQNTRLFEQTQRRADELSTLNEIARTVATELNVDQLLQKVFQQVNRTLPVDVFFIGLVDLRKNVLDIRYLNEGGNELDVPATVIDPNSNTQTVVDTGEYVLRHFSQEEVRTLEANAENGPGTIQTGVPDHPASSLYLPLQVGDNLVGIMSAQSYQYNYFTETNIGLLSGIANYVAVALQNARLFADTQRQAQREQLVNEITQKIQSTVTVESALRTTIQELGKALQARRTRVQLTADNGRSTPPADSDSPVANGTGATNG